MRWDLKEGGRRKPLSSWSAGEVSLAKSVLAYFSLEMGTNAMGVSI